MKDSGGYKAWLKRRKFKITKDTVTGDTKQELETDIMQLDNLKSLMTKGSDSGFLFSESAAIVFKTINELIAAKKEKLKEMS